MFAMISLLLFFCTVFVLTRLRSTFSEVDAGSAGLQACLAYGELHEEGRHKQLGFVPKWLRV